MSTLNLFISDNFKELQQFLKSISFSRAARVGIAVTLPAVLGTQLGYYEIGLVLSYGAFWSSFSDVTGSFESKKRGILISTSLVMIISFIKVTHFFFQKSLLLNFMNSIKMNETHTSKRWQ